MVRGNKEKCYYCGRDEWCTKDHFFPKSASKSADYINVLVYACSKCQRVKGSLMPDRFVLVVKNHSRYTTEEAIRIETAVVSLLEKLKQQ